MAVKDEFEFPDELEAKGKTAKATPVEDEIEVDIVDDTPKEDQGRKPLDREVVDPDEEELAAYSEKVKGRIAELTHARHDERRAKEALARERDELAQATKKLLEDNRKLRGFVDTGSKQYITQAVTLAEAEVEKAKKALKEAQDLFDSDAIVAAQEALWEAKTNAREAKNFRPTSLQEEEDVVQTSQSKPDADKPNEKTLRWQAKNQWFGSQGFEDVTSFAFGVHQKLVNSGTDPTSDEYFEQIDARIKDKFPEVFGATERPQPQSTSTKRPASVVAPATRSSGVRRVQLTATQVALASKFGLTPQQYAAQVALLEKQNG